MQSRKKFRSLLNMFNEIDILFFITMLILVLTTYYFSVESALANNEHQSSFWLNLSTEFIGAAIIYFILEIIIATRRQKQQLLRDLRSTDNALALAVIDELRKRKWIYDGTLENANLVKANLESAWLNQAYLVNVNFTLANLDGVDFSGADLTGARGLTISMLKRAASLEHATLPDGQKIDELSESEWRKAFDAWAQNAPVDANGCILPM